MRQISEIRNFREAHLQPKCPVSHCKWAKTHHEVYAYLNGISKNHPFWSLGAEFGI